MAMYSQDPRFLDICSSVANEMDMPTQQRTMPSTPGCSIPQLQIPDDAPPPTYRPTDSQSFSSRPKSDASLLSPAWHSSRRGSTSSFQSQSAGWTSDNWTTSSQSSSPGCSLFSANSAASSSILVPDHDHSEQLPNSNTIQPDSLIIRRACRFDCYCKCHSQSITVPNEIFSKFSTPILRPDKRSKVECTEPDCAGVTSATKRIPSMFFHRAVSRLLSLQSAKPGCHLNTYRMVSEGANPLRYVKHGNLEKLKLSITTREATPWDTAPDGWSLLHVCCLVVILVCC